MKRAACLGLVLLAALVSCRSEETAAKKQAQPAAAAPARAPTRTHAALGPDAAALRAAFNADAGTVRLVVLVAPT